MDDKTAEIPSLKNFSANSKKKTSSESTAKGSDRASSQQRRSQSHSASGRQSTQQKTSKTGDRADGKSGKSAPAPRTYARQRQDVSDAIARTQVVNTQSGYQTNSTSDRGREYSSEPQRAAQSNADRANYRRAESSQRRSGRTSSSDRAGQTPAKGSSGGNPPSGNGRKSAKKQRRPISPKARRVRRTVINVGLCLAVILIGVILSLTVWFKTETITVNGAGDIPKNEIIAASGLKIGENIFTAPKGKAEEKLERVFPYIKQAEIKAVFPNGISIDITMASPACVIEGLGGYYIVSEEGKVLEVSATADEIEAPVIEGVNVGGKVAGDYVEYGSSIVDEALKEMFTAFDELGCTEITAINISADEDTVEIKYVHDNRIVVYLGIPEHITYKIQTAHTIITEKIDTGGTMIAGDLDVSMCHDNMKSYFNQYTLLSPNSAYADEEETTAPEETQPDTQVYYY